MWIYIKYGIRKDSHYTNVKCNCWISKLEKVLIILYKKEKREITFGNIKNSLQSKNDLLLIFFFVLVDTRAKNKTK